MLQCNDFNRGHPRFFNQSEANSFTMNFDFVVFKANQKINLHFSTVGTNAADSKFHR